MPRNRPVAALWLVLAAAACDDDHFSISGTVHNEFAEPLEGVEVLVEWPEISSAQRVLVTRADGTYSYSWEDAPMYGAVLARVRITPQASGWVFTPTQRELQVDGEVRGLDFTGAPAPVGPQWLLVVTWDTALEPGQLPRWMHALANDWSDVATVRD